MGIRGGRTDESWRQYWIMIVSADMKERLGFSSIATALLRLEKLESIVQVGERDLKGDASVSYL